MHPNKYISRDIMILKLSVICSRYTPSHPSHPARHSLMYLISYIHVNHANKNKIKK